MNRLKALRKGRGLSLRALADKVGLTYSTLAYCERGAHNFSASSQKVLADFFGVSVDYLLGKSAEEMYDGFVDSIHGDFSIVKLDSEGEAVEDISEEVEPITRAKLWVVFKLQELQDVESIYKVRDYAQSLTALEDFPPLEPKKNDDSKDPKVAELKNKLIALIKKIDDIKSLEVLLSLAKERGTESEDGAK